MNHFELIIVGARASWVKFWGDVEMWQVGLNFDA